MQTAALFDLDGVLVDTEAQYTRFWRFVGMQDFPDIPDFPARIKGNTLTQIFAKYYPGDEAKQQIVSEMLAAFEDRMDYPYVPGAMAFVAALRGAGVPCAVVTSSNQAKMDCLYRAHPEFPAAFDRIFTAEDALRSKPAPDCYVAAARHFGLPAADCFVFEDSLSGLQAGQASGATVIALTTTNSPERVSPYCTYAMGDFEKFTVGQMLGLKK